MNPKYFIGPMNAIEMCKVSFSEQQKSYETNDSNYYLRMYKDIWRNVITSWAEIL